ncbi:MAG TPA: radical SAM protein [Planctomycetaceae bacterium]|nr:radical SAM protein [Planctomycetaceae bacterium]HIQ22035.1 radical SAM protein [Planctomycetota bacterium]
MNNLRPAYLELLESGQLAERARQAVELLAECVLCARQCRADRTGEGGGEGFCHSGRRARVSSYFPHHGEEVCLRGRHGSGTIFFSHCNLRCMFCQNYEISWGEEGQLVGPQELAAMMLHLQRAGCHNINFVTPSHVVPQILEALVLATEQGLNLPLVYNTGGYDSLETLRLLDGVVDIYMPDFKFWNPEVAKELAQAEDYPQIACEAIREMHRQVGDLVIDDQGLARRGLLVRHLVLPDRLAGTRQVMRFLAREVSKDTYVNIMAQYRPAGLARRFAGIDRSLTVDEYAEAIAIAREEGLWRFDRG